MCDSLNLPVRKVAAQILFIPHQTAQNYAYGRSIAPMETINKLAETIATVDKAARVYEKYPKQLKISNIKPVLHNAVRRRIIEIQAVRNNSAK